MRASARERSQVLRGRCLPYGDGVTFWPIGEIVRSAARINDEDTLEVALGKITEIARGAVGSSDDPTAVADRVAAAIGLSTTQFPGPELFWGIRRLLEAIASRRPLVAIVDDIHVAAPTFLELLDHLLDAVHGAPILLLTTARHELLDTRAEWAEGHEAEQILLGPLPAEDADAIVDQLLGGLDAARPRADPRGGRGQSAVRRADHLDADRDGGAASRRATTGSPRSRRTSWRSRPRSRPSSRRASTPSAARSGASSTRPRSSAWASRSTRWSTSCRRGSPRTSRSGSRLADRQADGSADGRPRRTSTGSATR